MRSTVSQIATTPPTPTWDAPPEAVDDLRAVVRCFRETLDPALGRDWSVPAGALEMSCRDTLDHLATGLAYYVGQLATRTPVRRIPIRDREDTHTAAELVEITETAALALAAVAEATPPDARAYHVLGRADPESFLAMACVEVLVHAWDVAQGLDLPMGPPAGIAPKLLRRLYRLAPTGHDAWQTVLYASGRIPLGDLPHRHDGAWGWHVPPLAEWDGSPSPTWEGIS